MRCLCGVLLASNSAAAFVSPFGLRSADTVITSRLARQPAGRVMMATGLPPAGGRTNNNNNHHDNMDDPFTANPVIPDRVGFSAIQKRIDSIERNGEIDEVDKSDGKGRGIRWVTARESGHRAATAPRAFPASSAALYTIPCAVWVLLFHHGSQSPAGSRSEPQRGLYCLWSQGLNSAVAFVERDGALRYALELKARGLVAPGPTRVAMKDLQHFCEGHGFGIWMVPAGVIPEAPQRTKKGLGFDPHHAAGAEQSLGGGAGTLGGWGRLPQRSRFSPLGFSSGEAQREDSLLTPEDARKYRADFERLFTQE